MFHAPAVLPLPSTLSPLLLWATSSRPMTQDALHTQTPNMTCLAGLQTAPQPLPLPLSNSGPGLSGGAPVFPVLWLHHHLPPRGSGQPPAVIAPTVGAKVLAALPPSLSLVTISTATIGPGPSTCPCRVPPTPITDGVSLLSHRSALLSHLPNVENVCLAQCATGSHKQMCELCPQLGHVPLLSQSQDGILLFQPGPLSRAVGDRQAASVSHQAHSSILCLHPRPLPASRGPNPAEPAAPTLAAGVGDMSTAEAKLAAPHVQADGQSSRCSPMLALGLAVLDPSTSCPAPDSARP